MKTYTLLLSLLFIFTGIISGHSQRATTHTVIAGNFYFSPANIPDVQVGDVIRWEWVEGNHTTTSVSIPAGAESRDAPMTSSNTVFEYTVTTAGQYNYKCTPHASVMLGSFMVTEPLMLIVTPVNRDVTFADGLTTFDVMSNANWTASSDASWCTVNPSGSGNGIITASFTENPDPSTRIANISVTVIGLLPVTVTVSQEGSTLGVDELSENDFTIFPNPTSGLFTIYPEENSSQVTEISIIDITGKAIKSERFPEINDNFKFDITTYPRGLYFIQIKTGTGITTHRIIKK